MNHPKITRRGNRIRIEDQKYNRLVGSICSSKYTEPELTEFVKILHAIAFSYLKYQHASGRRIRWDGNRYSGDLEDMALDCVAGLFRRNENGEFIKLTKYFVPYANNLHEFTNAEVLALLKRLVIKKTKQELGRLFKERDPGMAKTLRNLKLTIKRHADLHSFRQSGIDYVYGNGQHDAVLLSSGSENKYNGVKRNLSDHARKGSWDPRESLVPGKNQTPIPEKNLLSEFIVQFNPNDSSLECLRKMLRIVNDDKKYQNYLPVHLVAKMVDKSRMCMADKNSSCCITLPTAFDDMQNLEIELCKERVLRKIKKKIEQNYIVREKFSQNKGAIYHKALADFLNDFSDGKKRDSYYSLLKRYWPQLSQKTYRAEERSTFEYLCKLVAKLFRRSLKHLL